MSPHDQRIEFRINEDIAGRARDGLWGHPICLVLVFATTTDLRDHPAAMAAFAFVFAVQTALRFHLLRQVRHSLSWRRGIVSLLILSGGMWGLLAAWSCYAYGFHHPNTILLMLYHSAVAVLGTPTLVHKLRLTKVYLAVLLAPPMLVHGFFPDAQRWGLLCAYAMYAVYLSFSARKMSADYHQRLAEHIDLSAIASSDPLTGLPNRLAMRKRLALAIESARRTRSRVAFLFIDLDGFKAINDGYSHRVGDLFLCEVARRLALCGGVSSCVARLGGDEFTIMTGDEATALDTARDVLAAIRQSAVIEGQKCSVTASVGIGFFPDDAETDEELVRAADHAMYEAKRTGANQICFAGTRRSNTQVAQVVRREVNSPSPLTSVSRMSLP